MKAKTITCAVVFAMVAWFVSGCNPGLDTVGMDDQSVDQVQSALIGPDQDLSDFPPWIWPIIHPTDIVANVITGAELSFDKAAEMVKLSAFKLCECSTKGKYSFTQLLEMIEAGFDMQFTALKFAKIKVNSMYRGSTLAYEDDDWCGTPPKPWPWPWPLPELIRFEADVFVSELPQWYDLNNKQLGILKEHMQNQVLRFKQLLK